jgi:hypothetical protein
MAIILKVKQVTLFVSSLLFVLWYHSPNFLDTPHISGNQSFEQLQDKHRGFHGC